MSRNNFIVREHAIPVCHVREYRRATIDQEASKLQLHVKQYTPRSNPSPGPHDITIIAAAGSSFVKEIYEPLWDDLLQCAERTKTFRIRSIWITDPSNQGESAVLNAGKMGNDPSWYDHPRDLFLMINHFRDEISRPIVGIGHSQGGNCIVNLSCMHPRLFTTVILLDPFIEAKQSMEQTNAAIHAITLRKDTWPSRRAAEASFKRSAFFKTWDPRALNLYIKHGLVDIPQETGSTDEESSTRASSASESPVTLKTSRHQETFYAGRPKHPSRRQKLGPYWPSRQSHPDLPDHVDPSYAFYVPNGMSVYSRLPELRPSCLYIQPESSQFITPSLQKQRLNVTGIAYNGSGGVKEGMVEERVVMGTTHQLPLEKPGAVANEMAEWFAREMQFYIAQEVEADTQWTRLDEKEKTTISDDRIWWTKQERARAEEARQKRADTMPRAKI